MRKIDADLMKAIIDNKPMSKSNTKVSYSLTGDSSVITLHGHEIAVVDHAKKTVTVNFQGYITNVTRDRINAVMEAVGRPEWFRIKQGTLELMPEQRAMLSNETHTFTI